MRILLFAVALVSALYSGYWFLGRGGIATVLDQAEATLAERQIEVAYDSRETIGFPSRFDTSYTGLRLSGPGWRWNTPLAQIFALSYQPNHVIAYLSGPHDLILPQGNLRLETDDLRASLRVGAQSALPLRAAIAQGSTLRLSGQVPLELARFVVSLTETETEEAEEGPPRYRFAVDADAIKTPGLVLDALRIDADLGMSEPLSALAQAPQVTQIALKTARLDIGDSHIALSGSFEVDPQGYLSGPLRLSAVGWRALLGHLAQAGVLPPQAATGWSNILDGMAQNGQISAPLMLRRGQVMLGPLPVAQIPPLR